MIDSWKLADLLKSYHDNLDVAAYHRLLAELQAENETRSRSPLCERCSALGLDRLIDKDVTETCRVGIELMFPGFKLRDDLSSFSLENTKRVTDHALYAI